MLEDAALKSYLERLAVNLDVYAFGTAPGPDQEAKALPKELLYSETIKDTNEPTIVLHESDDITHAYVFWKIEVPICESPTFCCIQANDEQLDRRGDFTSPPSTSNRQRL